MVEIVPGIMARLRVDVVLVVFQKAWRSLLLKARLGKSGATPSSRLRRPGRHCPGFTRTTVDDINPALPQGP